jgi:hypothetical protein
LLAVEITALLLRMTRRVAMIFDEYDYFNDYNDGDLDLDSWGEIESVYYTDYQETTDDSDDSDDEYTEDPFIETGRCKVCNKLDWLHEWFGECRQCHKPNT